MKKISDQKQNLKGLKIMNTRPIVKNNDLNQSIKEAMGIVVHYPGILISPTSDQWIKSLPPLETVQKAIFTSTNAVSYSFLCLKKHNYQWPRHIEVIAVGNATARALNSEKIIVHQVPKIEGSESLINLLSLQEIANQTILLIKGHGGRSLISNTLKSRGAQLIELNVYKRLRPIFNPEELRNLNFEENNPIDIILFTSIEAMSNIINLFEEAGQSWVKKIPCLCISPRISQAARLFGMQRIITCRIDEILNALHQFNQEHLSCL